MAHTHGLRTHDKAVCGLQPKTQIFPTDPQYYPTPGHLGNVRLMV